jgi:hypothetical protein
MDDMKLNPCSQDSRVRRKIKFAVRIARLDHGVETLFVFGMTFGERL